MSAAPQGPGMEYESRKENFEVVCLAVTASELTAKPEDFKRVAVEAPDPLAALMSDEVVKATKGADGKKTHRALFAAKPNVMTDPEIMARSRSMQGDPVDRTKL